MDRPGLTLWHQLDAEFSADSGVASFPDDGASIGDLVRVADSRLSHAKKNGGTAKIVLSTSR